LRSSDYYGIDDVRELDLWQREFNIPPTEVAPIVSGHLVQAVWGLISPGTESREEAKKGFHIQCEVGDTDDEADLHERLLEKTLHRPC